MKKAFGFGHHHHLSRQRDSEWDLGKVFFILSFLEKERKKENSRAKTIKIAVLLFWSLVFRVFLMEPGDFSSLFFLLLDLRHGKQCSTMKNNTARFFFLVCLRITIKESILRRGKYELKRFSCASVFKSLSRELFLHLVADLFEANVKNSSHLRFHAFTFKSLIFKTRTKSLSCFFGYFLCLFHNVNI
jgi:hypothetical protein